MAEKKTIELEIKTDSVKSLKTQLREAQQEVQVLAEKFGATSREATEAAKKAAQLKDAIGDAKALTDAFNPDAKFKALTSSLSGVASGFTAYQGAMGLAGVESKELEKQLLKVQSAMALSQGLQQIGEARDSFVQLGAVIKTKLISAFSSLKSALISTGIGLFVIAIGVLIANFDKLKNVVSENTANAQKFADSTRMEGVAARETANDFAEYERTLKRLGYAEDEIRKKRGNKLKDAIESTEKEIEANKKLYKEQLKNLETVYKYDKFGFNATGRALYGSEEDAAKTREYIQGLRKDLEKLKNDQFELEQKAKEEEKTADKVVKSVKKKIEVKKEERRGIEDVYDVETDLLIKKRQLEEEEQKRKEKYFNDNIKRAQDETKKMVEINEQDLKNKQKHQERVERLRKQDLDLVSNGFKLIGDFTDLMGKRTEKERRRAFKIKKAADLASATIDGTKAVLSTYADTPGGPIIKGVAAGIAGAFSAIQIAKISKQQFDGGGSSGGGGSTTSSTPNTPSTSSGVISPKFNVVGASANQLNTLQQQPIQAYVVSGDVTSAQSLDRNRIKNATL